MTTTPGWPQIGGPGAPLREVHDLPEGALPRWCDHLSRDGKAEFYAQPYDLDAEALDDLVYLSSLAWDVTVSGYASHHPSAMTVRLIQPGSARPGLDAPPRRIR